MRPRIVARTVHDNAIFRSTMRHDTHELQRLYGQLTAIRREVATSGHLLRAALTEPLVVPPTRPVTAPVPATAARPTPPAPTPRTPTMPSLADRIAALDDSFDASTPDEDLIDTGTHKSALSQATKPATPTTPDEAELHEADDGTSYWGPVDNESARAKAAGKALIIDQIECITCGTCVENTAAVFVLPDDAKAVPYAQDGPMDLVQDAIDACPVTCIHWADPDTYRQLNDAEGNPLD